MKSTIIDQEPYTMTNNNEEFNIDTILRIQHLTLQVLYEKLKATDQIKYIYEMNDSVNGLTRLKDIEDPEKRCLKLQAETVSEILEFILEFMEDYKQNYEEN